MASSAAALMARARREIQHHFFEADAVRPDRAISFSPSNGFEQRIFDRYLQRGIVCQTSGQYWMDVVAYDVDLRRRHRLVRNLLLMVILVMSVAMLSGTVQFPR